MIQSWKVMIQHMWQTGCHNAYKLQKNWKCTFLKALPIQKQNEHQKHFRCLVSELPAKQCGLFGLNGPDWPYCLVSNSESGQ